MKLYTFPTAPNPRRVHLYLAEKGIDVPCETVDILARANRTPEFLASVNPLGGIPVLELDDGTHIAESVAICRYLEVLHPEPSLFGKSAEEVGRIEMWSRRIELNLMRPVGMVWVHGSPFTKAVVKEQIPAVAEQNRGLAPREPSLRGSLPRRPGVHRRRRLQHRGHPGADDARLLVGSRGASLRSHARASDGLARAHLGATEREGVPGHPAAVVARHRDERSRSFAGPVSRAAVRSRAPVRSR